LQHLVPFDLCEFFVGWAHLFLRFDRQIFGRPVDRFVDRARAQGLTCKALLDAGGAVKPCFICGYALALVQLPGGWELETCSAAGLKAVKSRRFPKWQERLAAPGNPEPDQVAEPSLKGDQCMPSSNV